MASIKKANLSAGPSKATKKAGPVDPKGQFTKVQKRTLGKMKAGGKVTKYQNAPAPIRKTAMQNLLSKYPGTDTSAAGDTRFEEFNAYSPKKALKKISDTDKAFNQKYGKNKPAKNKMGGKTAKKK